MKKYFFVFLIVFVFGEGSSFGQIGDTITVQTFTFGSPQDAWFVFPSDTIRYEKILMEYKLKCNPAQSPACGEWDAATYTYVYDHTGLLDSTTTHQPTYTVAGTSPDSVMFMNAPSYRYIPSWQPLISHTDTTLLNYYTIGSGSANGNAPFGTSNPVSRSQYLWKASEISAAGMNAGSITGMQFFLQSLGGELHNLTIRFQATALDSLTESTLMNSGFITVYSQNTLFENLGWNSLQFTNSFNWDGISNVLIEITYDNNAGTSNNTVASSVTSYNSGLVNAGADRCLSFHNYGYLNVPITNSLEALDSFVTVCFWTYGNPAYQPMDGTSFLAVDSTGTRILNAHLPWSDSNVYWDAGALSLSYDRISKAASTSEIEGQWNHWAFTKNVATGNMKIYLNGNLWKTGTGNTKRMRHMQAFSIGNNLEGATPYEGKVDEFAVFNTELSQTTIQAYMNKSIDAAHPNFSNLLVYYHFDDGDYTNATDASPMVNPPGFLNSVDNPLKASTELLTNFSQTTLRPNVVFEQGIFTSHFDSLLVVDSIENTPFQIIVYNDSVVNPSIATDTLLVWPVYYNNYVYDASGHPIDSLFVNPDSTLYLHHYDWYVIFPKIDRYELSRYITPYGNGLDLGSGFTWTFDVSDYRTLLSDSVHLAAGNTEELLDLKFLMIKGVPPRDVVNIKTMYSGSFYYGIVANPIENHLTPKTFSIPANAYSARWKSRVTGHGFGDIQNCAEFCPKHHYYKVNGVQEFSQVVWRDNCDLNPLYPQGGTWVYDRANWCPGAEVGTYDFEVTPFITPGGSITLDHDVEPYTWSGAGSAPGYVTEDQFVTYGSPNFTLDVELEDILSPSTNQMWLRYNPICTNPLIKIKNTGSTTLTSVTITYGLNGATPSTYIWTGSLPFAQSAEITLGNFNWAAGASNFIVTLSNPNGGMDQYSYNNSKTSHFIYPPLMPSQFVIEYKTNSSPSEDNYTLKDGSGTIIHSRIGTSLLPNTLYKDTLALPDGCYEFEMRDDGQDGLTWWANATQGNGYIRFKKVSPSAIIKNFNSDFGGQIYQQFTVGISSGLEDYILTDNNSLNVFPNPSDGHIAINIDLKERSDGKIEIYDLLGRKVYEYQFKEKTAESIEVNLSNLGKGMYFVSLTEGEGAITKKITIQ